MTVKYYDWVEYQSNFRPKKIAIKEISSGRETSYYELNQRSKSLAGWLQKKGLKKSHAQKYVVSLFSALSNAAVMRSNKDLKLLLRFLRID